MRSTEPHVVVENPDFELTDAQLAVAKKATRKVGGVNLYENFASRRA